MEQVRNEQTIYSTAVYCRLSKDDEQAGESVSIETHIVNVLENATTAVFFGAVVYFGVKLCISVSNQKLPASGISATLLYVLMILAMAIMCVHAIAHIAEDTVAIFGEKKELQGGAE